MKLPALAVSQSERIDPQPPSTKSFVPAAFVTRVRVRLALLKNAPDLEEARRMWLGAANDLHRGGRRSEAMKMLVNAPLALRNHVDLVVVRGRWAIESGDLDGAEAAGNQVLNFDNTLSAGYVLLARVAERRGDSPMAIGCWKNALQRSRRSKIRTWLLRRDRAQRVLVDRSERAHPLDGGLVSTSNSGPAFARFEALAQIKDGRGLSAFKALLDGSVEPWAEVLSHQVAATIYYHNQCYAETVDAASRALKLLEGQDLSADEKDRRRRGLDVVRRRARTALGEKISFWSLPPEQPVTTETLQADLDNGWRRAPKRSLQVASRLAFAEKSSANAQVLFTLLPLFQGDASRAVKHFDLLALRYRSEGKALHPDLAFAGAAVFGSQENHELRKQFIALGFKRRGIAAPAFSDPRARFHDLKAAVMDPVEGEERVTVCMTAFNAGQTIEHSIRSITDQSYAAFELLVVDDASSDDTAERVAECARHDGRIRLLRNKSNTGPYASRNLALDAAAGAYFTCHDADDWSHPSRLAEHIAFMQSNPSVIASNSNWLRMDPGGQPIVRETIGRFLHVNPASPFYRLDEVRRSIGYYDRVMLDADLEHWSRIRWHYGVDAVARLKAPLAVGLHHHRSLTRSGVGALDLESYSPVRSAYRREALHWRESRIDQNVRMEANPAKRYFPAPEGMLPA